MSDKPNVIVLAVGHSGSSVTVQMLGKLGWNLGEVKQGVYENRAVQSINKTILLNRNICPCGSDDVQVGDKALTCRKCGQTTRKPDELPHFDEMAAALDLTEPWIVKDPRFVVTWPHWREAFRQIDPLVLHLERDIERMRRTYSRYNFDGGIFGHSIEDLLAKAREHYEAWDGPKLSLRYEDVAKAVRLFDLGRAS